MGIGLLPAARGLRLLPELLPIHRGDAPDWVIFLCGVIFILSGLMVLVGQHSERLNHFLAALFTGIMGSVSLWASVLSPDESMGGGLAFVAHEQNIVIARCVFGFGAIFAFSLCGYAIKQLSKRKV